MIREIHLVMPCWITLICTQWECSVFFSWETTSVSSSSQWSVSSRISLRSSASCRPEPQSCWGATKTRSTSLENRSRHFYLWGEMKQAAFCCLEPASFTDVQLTNQMQLLNADQLTEHKPICCITQLELKSAHRNKVQIYPTFRARLKVSLLQLFLSSVICSSWASRRVRSSS